MKQKGIHLILAIGLAIIVLPALFSILSRTQTVHAATHIVNIFHDEDDNACDEISCSIRDAIFVAADGDDITIPAGTYTLSSTFGTLTVTENIVFNGNSATDTFIDAQGNSRVFNVTAGTVTFNNLTIQGGAEASGAGINADGAASLVLNGTIITGNTATGNGGGIAIGSGSLDLSNSQIMSNTAGFNGGGVYANNGPVTLDNSQVLTNTAVNSGGGLYINQAGASLVMNSGQINDNTANMTTGFPGGGVHIAQGSATIYGGEIRNNSAHRGGGILLSGASVGSNATITLYGGQIIDNEANYGGGVYVRGALSSTALLTINGGEISQNRSIHPTDFGGGGLYIFQGEAVMNGGEISANTAVNHGGAMEISEGSFTLNSGQIFNNSASNMGGAIYNDRGTLTINGGTIHTNSSTNDGGGVATGLQSHSTIANSAILTNTATTPANGGGIFNAGVLTVTNVTLSGNGAGGGAGLANSEAGTAVLTNVTIAYNSAINNSGGLSNESGGSITVGNSIIFGNSAADPFTDDCSGTINSANHNIAGSTCNLDGSSDSSSDPLLQPLALNDGATLNHALGLGSPAIDAGSNDLCPATDQRGNLRPVNQLCDIGAYEDGIGFFIGNASLTEGDAGSVQMSFTVTRSFTTTNTYTVDYETVNGTAETGLDYTAISDTLEFLPADETKTITVDILGDTLDEEDETFTVALSNPSGDSQLGNSSGTGTILDDDDPPTLSLSGDVTIDEGDSGTVTAVFTATLSAPSGKEITVEYNTQDGTAVAGEDYETASGTLTFNPGEEEMEISITINGDTTDEIDEMFTLELGNESNVTLTDSSRQVTISNDDLPPTLSIANASVAEGDSGNTNLVFTVSLSQFSSKTIAVDYMTTAGTATAGVDYDITNGTLTINPGDETGTITVPIIGDTADEFNETFTVELSNPDNATISDSSATGTITDDDPLPVATIGSATVTEGDSGTETVVFTVTLSTVSEKTITINYSSADDSATAGEDYTAVSGSLTFNPGNLSQTINVLVNGDEKAEQTEQFFINLTGSSNVTLGNSQATGTIIDDDGVLIYLPLITKP